MNLHFFRRAVPALAISVIAAILVALPRLNTQFFAGERYQECTQLTEADPQKSLTFAHAWRASHPHSPMARHCEGLALFAVKDYAKAAEALATLAKETGAANPSLALKLSKQAAEAYEAAGDHEKADDITNYFLKENTDTSPSSPTSSLPIKSQ